MVAEILLWITLIMLGGLLGALIVIYPLKWALLVAQVQKPPAKDLFFLGFLAMAGALFFGVFLENPSLYSGPSDYEIQVQAVWMVLLLTIGMRFFSVRWPNGPIRLWQAAMAAIVVVLAFWSILLGLTAPPM